MTVGMNIDALEMYEKISHILTLSIALIGIKTLIITAFCILFGFNKGVAFYSGLLLSQGGEFGFILFSLGKDSGVLEESTADILLLVVTFTMALTPLLAALGQKIAEKVDKGLGKTPTQMIELGARDLTNHIIIAGLGNTGKMVARVLEAEGISYVILDLDDDRVKEELSNGLPVFKGDVSQADTLKALGTERAFAIILTMNNQVTIKKSLKTISSNYQDIPVVVKLKNLKNVREFYDLGATTIIPESYETGLQIGGTVLKNIGISEQEINRIKVQFRLGNYIIAKKEDALSEAEDND